MDCVAAPENEEPLDLSTEYAPNGCNILACSGKDIRNILGTGDLLAVGTAKRRRLVEDSINSQDLNYFDIETSYDLLASTDTGDDEKLLHHRNNIKSKRKRHRRKREKESLIRLNEPLNYSMVALNI